MNKFINATLKNKIIAITPFITIIAFFILKYAGVGDIRWLVFLLIPAMPFLVGKKRFRFSFTVFALIIYLILGFTIDGMWGKAWLIFLLIPVYHILFTPTHSEF